jgi:threonine synthase
LKATESIMEVLKKPKVMKADVNEISAVVNWW